MMPRFTSTRPVAAALALGLAIAGVARAEPARHLAPDEVQAAEVLHVHLFVALCDNEHQGIVPVPASLGDGDSPRTNLYWGAMYGVRGFLPSHGWSTVEAESTPPDGVLERLVLRRTIDGREVLLCADAYRGREIEAAIRGFLRAAAGHDPATVTLDGEAHSFGGASQLVAYAGHDGLMEFDVTPHPTPAEGGAGRDVIVLACSAQTFFGRQLRAADAYPLVWTTGFMAPEAYTLDGALEAWAGGAATAEIARAAAAEYARYQKCAEAAARGLLVAGW